MGERQFERKTIAYKAESVDAAGTFTGYASVFGNVDSYGDVMAPGAFKDSIKRIKASGDPLPVLWQHRSSDAIGWSEGDQLTEDDHGLKVAGTLLVNDIPLAKQAHVLMAKRIVKGLSIGYYVEDSSFNEKEGTRTLKAVDLVEYSPVTFPANSLAEVESVKSIVRGGVLPTLKDFEGFLREAGFSNSQAKAIASGGLSKLLGQCEADGNTQKAADLLFNFKLR